MIDEGDEAPYRVWGGAVGLAVAGAAFPAGNKLGANFAGGGAAWAVVNLGVGLA